MIRKLLVAAAVLAVLVVVAVVGVDRPVRPAAAGTTDTATAVVARRTLSSRLSVGTVLGYAGQYTVLGSAAGTVTWLPAVGQVLRQGQALYRVDGRPVILLYGSTPAYRDLAVGVTGPDAAQLNRALAALGYDVAASEDTITRRSAAAVRRWQRALGVDRTGSLSLGQVVFLPTAVRVTDLVAGLGARSGGPVVKATSITRQVVVHLDAAQQGQVSAGDQVSITLPNGRTTPGRVAAVGKVATAGTATGPTVDVTVTPASAAATGTLDQAPVQVQIVTASVARVLVVPVTALLARAGGGYAVEVVPADGPHRLLPVTVGLFDDAGGLVQVSGAGLAAGQSVVVPAG